MQEFAACTSFDQLSELFHDSNRLPEAAVRINRAIKFISCNAANTSKLPASMFATTWQHVVLTSVKLPLWFRQGTDQVPQTVSLSC